MVRVRVTRGTFTVVGEETYEEGDEFDLPEEIAAEWPATLEQLDESGADSEDDEDDAEPPFDPSEFTIEELEAKLDGEEYSDAELEALQTAEEEGENREGALEAFNG